MLGRSVLIYEQLGMTRVSLSAVDIGRYVWAACGFSFISDHDRSVVTRRLTELETETGVPISGRDSGTRSSPTKSHTPSPTIHFPCATGSRSLANAMNTLNKTSIGS